jgi:hypothetical protein
MVGELKPIVDGLNVRHRQIVVVDIHVASEPRQVGQWVVVRFLAARGLRL